LTRKSHFNLEDEAFGYHRSRLFTARKKKIFLSKRVNVLQQMMEAYFHLVVADGDFNFSSLHS